MKKINIKLEPLGKIVKIEAGLFLQDILFEYGIEFPCGGNGICGKCKIRLLEGNLAVNDIQRQYFSKEELANGWRLACQCRVMEPVALELVQWEMQILSDDQEFRIKGQNGFAVAVDLGSTTLVAQLIDEQAGKVIGTETALNAQAKYGADIMSRIDFALNNSGSEKLQKIIRQQIYSMVRKLIRSARNPDIQIDQVGIVGNTVMHHLFCGKDITPMSRVPFETENGKEWTVPAREIDWTLPGNPELRFYPCLGSFVGSDILAGIIATELYKEEELTALIDLGTNGEIVVGDKNQILCASTAAGPAFEGAKISRGMRAMKGAISKVTLENGQMKSHIIGGGSAKGICGSGLVDAVACALEMGLIDKSGRIHTEKDEIVVQSPVIITQQDIRELQLAKAAIAAGLEILCQRLSASLMDIQKIYIAGAFGNYINVDNAVKIGLINNRIGKIIQAGNTALNGVKKIIIQNQEYQSIFQRTRHIPLAVDTEFMDRYVDNMNFP